jgi:hypothetical protein
VVRGVVREEQIEREPMEGGIWDWRNEVGLSAREKDSCQLGIT